MTLPLNLDSSRPSTLQRQIFEQVRGLILGGRLVPGTRMPATRALGVELGVSRNTVVLAYEWLVNEGYLEANVGTGTFVSRSLGRPNGSDHRPVVTEITRAAD